MEGQNQVIQEKKPLKKRTLSEIRTQGYKKLRESSERDVSFVWKQVHSISALIIARAIILGPLERMKIILQVKSMAKFTNPKDCPTGFFDLSNSNFSLLNIVFRNNT